MVFCSYQLLQSYLFSAFNNYHWLKKSIGCSFQRSWPFFPFTEVTKTRFFPTFFIKLVFVLKPAASSNTLYNETPDFCTSLCRHISIREFSLSKGTVQRLVQSVSAWEVPSSIPRCDLNPCFDSFLSAQLYLALNTHKMSTDGERV